MKVLFVVNWYPPDQRVPARRWGSLVASLQTMGVQCTVVAAGDGQSGDQSGAAGERVVRLPISNRSLINLQPATSGNSGSIKREVKRMVLRCIPPVLADRGVRRWRKILDESAWLRQLASESDWVLASYGPLGPLMLGYRLASEAGTPLLLDIRDGFEAKDGELVSVARWLSRWLEARLLARAQFRITVGKVLADYLARQYRLPFTPIYNGWVDTDVLLANKSGASEGTNEGAYLYYAGSFYTHRLPALTLVLKALSQSGTVKLKIRLLMDHTDGELQKVLRHAIEDGSVELLPAAEQTVVDEEARRALGLLVLETLEPSDERGLGTVTGKLIPLLASGKPGIAVAVAGGEIRYLVSQVDGWWGVDTAESCACAINALADGAGIQDMAESLAPFHVNSQARRLLALLEQAKS